MGGGCWEDVPSEVATLSVKLELRDRLRYAASPGTGCIVRKGEYRQAAAGRCSHIMARRKCEWLSQEYWALRDEVVMKQMTTWRYPAEQVDRPVTAFAGLSPIIRLVPKWHVRFTTYLSI